VKEQEANGALEHFIIFCEEKIMQITLFNIVCGYRSLLRLFKFEPVRKGAHTFESGCLNFSFVGLIH